MLILGFVDVVSVDHKLKKLQRKLKLPQKCDTSHLAYKFWRTTTFEIANSREILSLFSEGQSPFLQHLFFISRTLQY